MIKTVYWNNIEIHNMSAEVEIPDDIASQGDSAIIEYLHDNEFDVQELGSEDDSQLVEAFDNVSVGN